MRGKIRDGAFVTVPRYLALYYPITEENRVTRHIWNVTLVTPDILPSTIQLPREIA
jgi:hypothetical protein